MHCADTTLYAIIGLDRGRPGRDVLPDSAVDRGALPAVRGSHRYDVPLDGADAFESLDAIFAPDVSRRPNLGVTSSAGLGALVLLTFPIVNASAEEPLFRWYSRARLAQGVRATRHDSGRLAEPDLQDGQDAPTHPRGTTSAAWIAHDPVAVDRLRDPAHVLREHPSGNGGAREHVPCSGARFGADLPSGGLTHAVHRGPVPGELVHERTRSCAAIRDGCVA